MLALLVLVSSTSFMVGMHLCMGEVRNISFFTPAESCDLAKSLPPCHRHTLPPCCDDETLVHNGEDFQALSDNVHLAAPAADHIVQPNVLIAEVIPASPASRTPYYHYDPPLRTLDLTVEHRVFLI